MRLKTISSFWLALVVLLLVAGNAQATMINQYAGSLSPNLDSTIAAAINNRDYDPQVIGSNEKLTYTYSGRTGGVLTITGWGNLLLVDPALNTTPYALTFSSFNLRANFNTSGQVTSGTLTVRGTENKTTTTTEKVDGINVTTTTTVTTGPTIAKSVTLEDFWFKGDGSTGIMQFKFANNISGTTFSGLDPNLYLIVEAAGLTTSGRTNTSSWGTTNAFWQAPHTATVSTDTFTPIPPALWLFGSGLGFLGLYRRRQNV